MGSRKKLLTTAIAVVMSFLLPMAAAASSGDLYDIQLNNTTYWATSFTYNGNALQAVSGSAYNGGTGYWWQLILPTGGNDTTSGPFIMRKQCLYPGRYTISPTGKYTTSWFMDYRKADWNISSQPVVQVYDNSGHMVVGYGESAISPLGDAWGRYAFKLTNDEIQQLDEFFTVEFCFNDTSFNSGQSIGTENPSIYVSDPTTEITDQVKAAADQIVQSIQDGANNIINEDYGYTSPNNANTDDALGKGGSLLDSLTSAIDDFNATIDEGTNSLINNVNRIADFTDGVYALIPMPIQVCFVGLITFIVMRKVVGR